MWENILGSHYEINQPHSLWLNLFHFNLLGYEMSVNTALCHQLTKCFIIFERTNYMYIGELYHLWFLLEIIPSFQASRYISKHNEQKGTTSYTQST